MKQKQKRSLTKITEICDKKQNMAFQHISDSYCYLPSPPPLPFPYSPPPPPPPKKCAFTKELLSLVSFEFQNWNGKLWKAAKISQEDNGNAVYFGSSPMLTRFDYTLTSVCIFSILISTHLTRKNLLNNQGSLYLLIISFTLIALMHNSGVILKGRIRFWSLSKVCRV